MGYYDDNFGHWESTNKPEVVEFYNQVQRESLLKACEGCGEIVKLRREYAYCNSCVDGGE